MALAEKYPGCWMEALKLLDRIEKLLKAAAAASTPEETRTYLDQALALMRSPTGA
jgi:hypothetical protein